MRTIYDLNTKWAFTKQADSIPNVMPKNWCFVNLPHTWNAIDGQDGENDYYRGTCYYAKEIAKSELPENRQYFLEIQGANSSADVYVNGKKLAHHDGGYSTFRVNITEALEEMNLFVIAVDNGINEHVYPQNADFTFYGGLYRQVQIIGVNESHFDLEYFGGPGIKVTPSMEETDATVFIETYVINENPDQILSFYIKNREGKIVASESQRIQEKNAVLKIPQVHLWNGIEDPYLYKAEVFLEENGEVIDKVSTKFGCRTFSIDPEKGFYLNGKSYPLRGVSRHQDRWGIGNALLKEHHKEDMDMICEMGANTIRLAHYQHDQYFYDLCDEKGMIVWAEIPYISSHMPAANENAISQMKELVIQNYNHPSIVVWGISNEITIGVKDKEDLIKNHMVLNYLVHQMDETRKTTIAVVSMCDINDPYIQIPDVISYNHYFGWYGGDVSMNGPWLDHFHEVYPQIPLGVSEYGCEALNWHTSDPKQGDYTEEYQAYYHEELIKQLFTRPYLWATHVWNMFDFGADARCEGGENGQNHKGLVTFDRKYKKDAFYAYKAWLSKEPFVHICGKRYQKRVEKITKVTVYSNLLEVELFVNGKSLGKQRKDDHFFYFEVPNEGESILTAIAGECRDESVIYKVETFCETYRLKEKGMVLNWFDVTQKEGFYSLNDTINDILKSEEGKKVFSEIMKKIVAGMDGKNSMISADNSENMMKMLGGFTVLRLFKLFHAANISLTKEQMLEINERLNKISKAD